MCFLKVVVRVVSMTIKMIFPLMRPLSLATELGESGRRGVNLSGILIFTKRLWNYICVYFNACIKMNCNCLELQSREEDLKFRYHLERTV